MEYQEFRDNMAALAPYWKAYSEQYPMFKAQFTTNHKMTDRYDRLSKGDPSARGLLYWVNTRDFRIFDVMNELTDRKISKAWEHTTYGRYMKVKFWNVAEEDAETSERRRQLFLMTFSRTLQTIRRRSDAGAYPF